MAPLAFPCHAPEIPMAPIRPFCVALLCLALPVPVLADARSELHAAFAKNLALKSYRAQMTDLSTGKPVSTVEFQAPDRYRISVPGRPTSLVANNTMYLEVNGKSLTLALPAGLLDQYRSDATFRRLEAKTRFTDLGAGTVGTEPARKYHWDASGRDTTAGDAWVSVRTGLVLQVESAGKVRVTYSDFNSPAIRIEPPR
jgi:hypothetical protein